jgi:hypothetical protein
MPHGHAIYGGSSAHAWMNCAATISLCAQMPAQPTNQAAAEGTACHDCMDVMLKDTTREPHNFLGATVLGVKIEQEHVMQMDIALDAYIELCNEFPADGAIKSEVLVKITDDAWGTSDILMYTKDHLKVADFKFGTLEIVDAERNEQLMFYAVAARKTLGISPKTIELIIIQPCMDPAMSRYTIDATTLDAFETTLYAALRAAKAPHPMPVEGEWCRWRQCKLICPLKLNKISTLTLPNHALNLDDVGTLLAKIENLMEWREQARERIQHELEHGTPVKGWKLVAKRAIRQWRDEKQAIALFKKRKLRPDQYQITKLVSPAQAEKLVDKKIIATMADPVSSGNTIAQRDDKRPEVIPTAALARALHQLV